jgi:hypothetical protein
MTKSIMSKTQIYVREEKVGGVGDISFGGGKGGRLSGSSHIRPVG